MKGVKKEQKRKALDIKRVGKRIPRVNERLTHLVEKGPRGSNYVQKIPSWQVDLRASRGKKLFAASLEQGYADAFFPLVSQFKTQSHPNFCALATLTIILNTLQIDSGKVWKKGWRWITEESLSCCFDLEEASKTGATIEEVGESARLHGCNTRTFRKLSSGEFRSLLKRVLRNGKDENGEFMAVSYDRKSLEQPGGGHFSPIAAYEESSDCVLVLDTARYKYGPHWIPLEKLVEATYPKDSATGLSRGFMTFSRL